MSVPCLNISLVGCSAGNCVVLQSRFEEPEDVHGIIMRGPEALQSQFSTGYGMVLNLLHSRSLAEAREFIQRSFSNYLGALAQNCCLVCASNPTVQRHCVHGATYRQTMLLAYAG